MLDHVPSKLSAAGVKRGMRNLPMRTVPSRRSTWAQPAEGRPGSSSAFDHKVKMFVWMLVIFIIIIIIITIVISIIMIRNHPGDANLKAFLLSVSGAWTANFLFRYIWVKPRLSKSKQYPKSAYSRHYQFCDKIAYLSYSGLPPGFQKIYRVQILPKILIKCQ